MSSLMDILDFSPQGEGGLRRSNDFDRRDRSRIGLYYGQTGHPCFVVGLSRADLIEEPTEIRDLSELKALIPDTTLLLDRMAFQSIHGFFRAGGKSLLVLPLVIKATPEHEGFAEDFAKTLLGEDQGYLKRKGYSKLRNYDSLYDLLVFPQVAVFLGADLLRSFYQRILSEIEHEKLPMLLMDTPCYSSPQKVLEWAKPLQSSCGALFYPWVSMNDLGFLPSSTVVSAALQGFDSSLSIAQPPANRVLSSSFRPLAEIQTHELAALVKSQINVLRILANGEQVLWGNSTLLRNREPSSLLHISRTLRSLQDAIERTCEVFLLEPKNESTRQRIEASLTKFLENLSDQGLFLVSQSNPGFTVEVEIKTSRVEDFIEIDLQVSLIHPDQFIGVRKELS